MLLSPAQSRALWETAIAESRWADALLDVPKTAARALDAWKTAHAWRIAGALDRADGTEDARAFAEWARAYARRLKKDGFIDLPLLFDSSFKNRTKLLVAYAFDILPPQTQDLFKRFEYLSSRPQQKESLAIKTAFASPREELEAAAGWARARLEEGKKSIGVVVPELKLRRREVARVFARVMRPGFNLPGAASATPPFDMSGGEPLDGNPLVAFALALLEFSIREMPFEEASRLIRSPFLAGAEGERRRARYWMRSCGARRMRTFPWQN